MDQKSILSAVAAAKSSDVIVGCFQLRFIPQPLDGALASAMASKVSTIGAAVTVRATFMALRTSLGSAPFASNLRASSRQPTSNAAGSLRAGQLDADRSRSRD